MKLDYIIQSLVKGMSDDEFAGIMEHVAYEWMKRLRKLVREMEKECENKI